MASGSAAPPEQVDEANGERLVDGYPVTGHRGNVDLARFRAQPWTEFGDPEFATKWLPTSAASTLSVLAATREPIGLRPPERNAGLEPT